jgi:hypothetical protein
MALKSVRYKGLLDFLADSFRPESLEIFLTLNGYGEVVKAVSRSSAGDQYFFRVVQELDHRGLIDDKFFNHLTQERPKKAERIQGLAKLWLAPDETGSELSSGTTPNRPPAVVPTEPAPPRDPALIMHPQPATAGDQAATVSPEPPRTRGQAERPPAHIEARGPRPVRQDGPPRGEPQVAETAKSPSHKGLFSRAAVVAVLLALLGYTVREFTLDRTKVNHGSAPETSNENPKSSPVPANGTPSTEAEPEFLTTRLGQIKLKRIPADTFLMGSPENDKLAESDEKPQREVRISRPFYLGVWEMTQVQYQAVMGQNPSWFSSAGGGKDTIAGLYTDQHPVEGVDWLDAVRFCNTLSERESLKPFYEIKR